HPQSTDSASPADAHYRTVRCPHLPEGREPRDSKSRLGSLTPKRDRRPSDPRCEGHWSSCPSAWFRCNRRETRRCQAPVDPEEETGPATQSPTESCWRIAAPRPARTMAGSDATCRFHCCRDREAALV